MLPSAPDNCDDDCVSPAHRRRQVVLSVAALPGLLAAVLPFVCVFVVVAALALRYLHPLLAAPAAQHHALDADEVHFLPADAPSWLRDAHARHANPRAKHRRRLEALTLAVTVGLAAVLALLIVGEISNIWDAGARALGLTVVIPTLLVLLVLWIPFLELQSLVARTGWSLFEGSGRREGSAVVPWLLQLAMLGAWLTAFWWLGKAVPATFAYGMSEHAGESLREACLERVGVIGISLMALLAGFASISSPWQSFGVKYRPVTDSDIARKKMGLDSTHEMLLAKRSRLRALSRKLSDAPQGGLVTRVIGNFRGNADVQESKTLELEISGLESMEMSLASSLTMLQTRRAVSLQASTPLGKLMTLCSHVFSVYCVYRIIATLLTTLRRWSSPSATFSTTDPITRVLSLLAKHWDPTIDQAAWARQISFLLSGVILTLSFSSVLQTVHLFSRFVPGALYRQAQANLPLLVAQITATYVISSALLLRSNLPRELGSAITDALGSPLEPYFVDRWFEGVFLLSSALTALGIWAGRRLRADWDDDWDDLGDVEAGQKRH